MAKSNVQFHAAPEEIISFLKECVKELKLYLVTVQLFPVFKTQLYLQGDNLDEMRVTNEIRFILLCHNKPDMSENQYFRFMTNNKGCLVTTLGEYEDNTLKESSLGFITEDAETLKLWRSIIKKFKSLTITGAWVVSPYGAKGYYKNHRYTPLAKRMFEEGTKILPMAGWNYYLLNHNDI